MSAFTPGRSGDAGGRSTRVLATRGATLAFDGSSAPASGLLRPVQAFLVALCAATLLVLVAVLPSSAPAATYTQGTTFCSGSGSGAEECEELKGIAVDQETGMIYVVDAGNLRVNQFAPNGTFVRAFGWNVRLDTPAEEPQVCNIATGCKKGVAAATTSPGQISSANGRGIAVDSGTHIVYVTSGAALVNMFNGTTGNFIGSLTGTEGTESLEAAPEKFAATRGLAIDESNPLQHFLWVAINVDVSTKTLIHKYKVAGPGNSPKPAYVCQVTGTPTASKSAAAPAPTECLGGPSQDGAFTELKIGSTVVPNTQQAGNIGVDGTGDLVVAESFETTRRVISGFSKDGTYLYQFRADKMGTEQATEEFPKPEAIAVAPGGNVFAAVRNPVCTTTCAPVVNSAGGNRIQEYVPDPGATPPATPTPVSEFTIPGAGGSFGIALDSSGLSSDGTIYIADKTEKRIWSFTPEGGGAEHDLDVEVTGDGKVDEDPAGQIADCREAGGENCSGTYAEGTEVLLKATPDDGHDFVAWGVGDCDSEPGGDCKVTIDDDVSVTATFAPTPPEEFDLDVEVTGEGEVDADEPPVPTSGGIAACRESSGDCLATYTDGDVVTLQATEDSGHEFLGWSGAGCAGTGTCVVTMDAQKSVSASFGPAGFVNFTANANGEGEVKCDGGACATSYPEDTVVVLSAHPGPHSVFDGWSSVTGSGTVTTPCTGTTNPCEVKLDSAVIATAAFGPVAVTDLNPDKGPESGGTVVEITGTNFTDATAVSFGATPATGFTVDSDTKITATAPAGTGTVDVAISVGAAVSADTAADDYAYVPKPVVSGLNPDSGPTIGTNQVTITGSNLSGVEEVTFGANPATGLVEVSPSEIKVTAPAGAAGPADVAVTTAGGTSANTVDDDYTYLAVLPPVVDSCTPTQGPTTGGAQVTIEGSNLADATGVTFGGVAATGLIEEGPTKLKATSPAGTGTVDVIVSTPGGLSAEPSGCQHTYVAVPTVSVLNPNKGPLGGGNQVTITGTNLDDVTEVKFGPNPTNLASLDEVSASEIKIDAPAGTGAVDVIVTTAGGGPSANTANDNYTYVAAPTITLLNPAQGPAAGTNSVVITGTNLSSVEAIEFDSAAATISANTATSVTATNLPAHAPGPVEVKVTTAGGTATSTYTYVAKPIITGLDPSEGPTTGGTLVTITGESFEGASGAAAVKFGSANATSYTVVSDTQITATAPAGAAGTVRVTVTTAGGASDDTAADDYTYVLRALTVSKEGEGSGTVISTPAGIACGATCSFGFAHGTAVTLVATPGPKTAAAQWSGCDSVNASNHCLIAMDAAATVEVTFDLERFELAVSKPGTGSGTVTSAPAGIACGATCSALYEHSTTVELSAVAAPGSEFVTWTGACSGTGACEVTLDSARKVSAIFDLIALPDPIIPIPTCETDPALCPKGDDPAKVRRICIAKANTARKRAVKAAKARKGKARGRAMRVANKRKAAAVKRCSRAFQRQKRG